MLTVVAFAVSALLVPLALTEFYDWCPRIAQAIVRWSARRLHHPEDQARYEEEYLANLAEVPGRLSQLLAALGYAGNVVMMRRTLRSQPTALEAAEPPPPRPVLQSLIAVHQARHPTADIAVLGRAYAVAEHHHAGVNRKSGDPYITHPLAVAAILGEHGADTTILTAALLHDTIQDTRNSPEELQRDFGDDLATIVLALTALDTAGLSTKDADSAIRTFVRMSDDPRVLMVKLADRMHNLRTVQHVPEGRRIQTARTSLDVLLPLARHYGLNFLNREIEDRAFALLDAANYRRVRTWIRDTARDGRRKIAAEQLAVDLQEVLPDATVDAPPDGCYALWRHSGQDPPVLVRVLLTSPQDIPTAVDLIVTDRTEVHVTHSRRREATSIVAKDTIGLPLEIEVTSAETYLHAKYGSVARWIAAA